MTNIKELCMIAVFHLYSV